MLLSALLTILFATESGVIQILLVGLQVAAIVAAVVLLHCVMVFFGVVIASFAIVVGVKVEHGRVTLLVRVFIAADGIAAVVQCVALSVSIEIEGESIFW